MTVTTAVAVTGSHVNGSAQVRRAGRMWLHILMSDASERTTASLGVVSVPEIVPERLPTVSITSSAVLGCILETPQL